MSETSARASRFAFALGSFARKGLIGGRAGVAEAAAEGVVALAGGAGSDGGATAGLSIRIDEAHHYDLEVSHGAVRVNARIGPLCHVVAEHPVRPGPVTLSIETRTYDVLPPAAISTRDGSPGPFGVRPAGPDTITFALAAEEPVTLAELDGRYLSTEVAAGFTGRVIGMYVTDGQAAFDWFEYQPGLADTAST